MNSLDDGSSYETSITENQADPPERPRGAGCALVIVSPIIAMVGTMRWNIPGKIDADLAAIMTWFCDTVLVFLLLYPVSLATNNGLIKALFDKAAKSLGFMIYIFLTIGVVGFVVATIVAFHYLFSQLFAWAMGH